MSSKNSTKSPSLWCKTKDLTCGILALAFGVPLGLIAVILCYILTALQNYTHLTTLSYEIYNVSCGFFGVIFAILFGLIASTLCYTIGLLCKVPEWCYRVRIGKNLERQEQLSGTKSHSTLQPRTIMEEGVMNFMPKYPARDGKRYDWNFIVEV